MFRSKAPNIELLLKLPWWISATLGTLTFVALRWGLPAWAGTENSRLILSRGLIPLAPLTLLIFGLFAAFSFWFGRHRRELLDQQKSVDSLRALPWKQFEFLLAEAYQRQGYQVEYALGRGADGGVDLILRRDNRTALVQCKQWQVFSVGAPTIREMFGIMTAENADAAIIVTSGKFTTEARGFAAGKPIRLLDGPQLLALVQSVQTNPTATSNSPLLEKRGASSEEPPAPVCPQCGKPMLLRTARRGANNRFWGCSGFPACKTILELSHPHAQSNSGSNPR